MNENRYLRQTLLPEIGAEGQERLKNSRVLCVGSGGLGSPALLYLAAAGVGRIGVIDPDTVSISNLQRQILFRTSYKERAKVEAAKESLLELNPEIEVITYFEAFTDKNALAMLGQYDIVIDGSDNFSTKYLINDAAYLASIPVVYGSVSRFEGQVALFHGQKGSCYRCLHPSSPVTQIKNCAESGVLGSVVGTIGTLQATLALQFLLSRGEVAHPLQPEYGKLTIFDFKGSWSIQGLRVPKNPGCPTCSVDPKKIRLHYSPEICARIEAISVAKLQDLLAKKSSHLLIDVREDEEWNDGHLPGAVHWPLSLLEKNVIPTDLSFEKKSPIILYCTAGIRSEKAAQFLMKNRSLICLNLEGGIQNWCGAWIAKT